MDAAIFKEEGRFGLGMCMKNDKGEVISAQTLWFYGVPPLHEAEAIGILEAINWSAGLGYHHVTVE